MKKTIYCRFPLDTYSAEQQFFCVYKTNLEAAKNALKDINDLEYAEPNEMLYTTYHIKHQSGVECATTKYIKDGDVWLHSITHSGSDSFYYQLLNILKSAGFEFSPVVSRWVSDYELATQKELKRHEEEKAREEERQREQSKFKYVSWCDKYACPALNGCGDCKRQIYGCHTRMVKVRVS